MGILGAVGFVVREGHHFGSPATLKTSARSYVVLDATKALDKLVLAQIRRTVSYFSETGCSTKTLADFYRLLIMCLRHNNVEPLFVFNGGRKSESQFGPRVSGADYFRSSCNSTLRNIERRKMSRNYNLPELCTNVLKEVICELKLEQNMAQATYEVYPTLCHLARKYSCPVITGHSDFIFHNAPHGFYWFDRLTLPSTAQQPITGTLYEHARLLQRYNLSQEHSSSLRTFSTLLRSDFQQQYYNTLNALLRLSGPFAITVNRYDGKQRARLTHIVGNMSANEHLRSHESIRSFLSQFPRVGTELMRDFDNTHETYCAHFDDFAATEFCQILNRGPRGPQSARSPQSPVNSGATQASRVQPADLQRALTRGQTTAEFVFNLTNTTFARPLYEDLTLARSIFSLQDVGRQFLLDNAMAPHVTELRVYDRRLDLMQLRVLRRGASQRARLDGEGLLKLMHSNSEELEVVARHLRAMHIDGENGRELALLLMVARFAFRLAFRRDYNNGPPQASGKDERRSSSSSQQSSLSNTTTPSLGSQWNGADGASRPLRQYPELMADFYVALVNSFIYHAREHQGDQTSQTIPADLRVARQHIDDILSARDPSLLPQQNFQQYIKLKHLIEAMNSVLHCYVELNSLFDFPAPRLHLGRHYDGVLIYKIISRLSRRLRGLLLDLSPDLMGVLDLGSPVASRV